MTHLAHGVKPNSFHGEYVKIMVEMFHGLNQGLVSVNYRQCNRIATRSRGVKLKPAKIRPLKLPSEREDAVRRFFYFMAICHDTRELDGEIEGKYYRGSDYLYYALKRSWDRNQNLLAPQRMAQLGLEPFQSWLSPDGNPKNCKIKRPRERVELIRDCGEKLLKEFDGKVTAILNQSHGYIQRPDGKGLRSLLAKFKAYSDPLAKKVMVLTLLLRLEGLFDVKDPENLTMGIDYHVMRIALRSGIVIVKDKKLERTLKQRLFASQQQTLAVRNACIEAYTRVAKKSKIHILDLDMILWQLGRNCCHYAHEPCCDGVKCNVRDCTLPRDVYYKCEGKCVLDGLCLGSKDPEYIRLLEPKVITFYY